MTKSELELKIEALETELKKAKQTGLRTGQYTDPNNGITYANQEVPVQVSNPVDTGGRFIFTISVPKLRTFLETVPNDNQVSISTRLYQNVTPVHSKTKARPLKILDSVFAGEVSVSSKNYSK